MSARADYLARQRWCGAWRGSARVTHVDKLPWLRAPTDGFGVRFELVHVEIDGQEHIYNVPASYRQTPFDGLDTALMDHADGYFVYDAMLDAHARTELLTGFFGPTAPALDYETVLPLDIEALVSTVPLVAEQSNTSIIIGDSLLLKLFRKVGHGRNPDIEINTALTTIGTDHVAPVRGWIRAGDIDLAMVYDYYRSASDGWDSARASFRDFLAESGVGAGDAGGDFAAESARLGATVGTVHGLMAAELQTDVWGHDQLVELADRLDKRFEEAHSSAPILARWERQAHMAYDELRDIDAPVPVQRVHGDLHLGQTLRTTGGWKLIDFEGEPIKPLSDRVRMDSPLRDVAAMLRSFDYVPHSVLMQVGSAAADEATRWAVRNQEAFLRGYGIDEDAASFVLLRCYQIDKAAYEVMYESQHRPRWVNIPLGALDRLLT